MSDSNGSSARGGALDSELLADFGHQLRNQLNAIVGAAGLLLATATSSDQRELASVVLSGSEELAGMVDEVLDSDLIESGDFELALHPFSLRTSSEMCVGRVGAAASGKGVTVTFHAADDVPTTIIGDSRRLEQVLHSLLRLAVDRTEQGVVDAWLTSEPNEGPLKLRFHISAPTLVLPARLIEAGMRRSTSSGLGPGERLEALSLHTTRHIVEMMDGELTIATGAGVQGAEIDFTFLALAASGSGASERSLSGMQVLIVAADATERRVLRMQTEIWGAPSTACEPGEAQGHIAGGHAFDVAVIEHRKPVIDGLAVATAIRALRSRDELPIVLLVSGALGSDEVTAADSGIVQATLGKPVTPQKLHDVLAQVGHRRSVPAPPPIPEAPSVKLNVLVADDNALNQNMLRRQITRLGHSVDIVSNGREAVYAVEQHPYDALLMDVLMPEMDGLAAAGEICRRWTPGTRPRLIALTAMAGPGDEERCRKAGFDDYMSKPVHLDELAEALKAAAGWRAAPKTLG